MRLENFPYVTMVIPSSGDFYATFHGQALPSGDCREWNEHDKQRYPLADRQWGLGVRFVVSINDGRLYAVPA